MLNRKFLVTTTLLFLFLSLQCTVEKDKITGPTTDPSRYLIFKKLTSSKNQLFTDGDTCLITLQVVNPADQPKAGLPVSFSALNLDGVITATDTTDSSGLARAVYSSGSVSGIEKVFATAGEKADSLFFLVVDRAVNVSITADPTTILADGQATLEVTAQVADEQGTALPGISVFFQASAGTITSTGTTDETGTFIATLTSIPDSNDVTVLVRSALQPLPSPAPVPARELRTPGRKAAYEPSRRNPRTPPGRPGAPNRFQNRQLESLGQVDSLEVTLRGITILLQSSKPVLMADGTDVTDILVDLTETSTGTPLTYYNFTATTTPRGTLSGTPQTDESGQATLQLRSGTVPGTATVRVTVGTGLVKSIQVPFISAYPTTMHMEQSQQIILADGESTSDCIVTVIDTLGNPAENIRVQFNTTLGQLTLLSSTTNADGQITARLKGTASKFDAEALVTAYVVDHPHLRDSVEVEFRGVSLTSYTNVAALVANGYSSATITTVVYQTTTNGAVADREVYFSSTLGTITSPVVTNPSGVATATLTAGIFSGTTTVIARFGNLLTDTLQITLLSGGANSMLVTRDPENIWANGQSSALISAEVTDTLGNPVEGALVYFGTSLGSLSAGMIASDEYGLATTELTSTASTSDLEAWVTCSVQSGLRTAQDHSTLYPPLITHLKLNHTAGEIVPLRSPGRGTLVDSVRIRFKGISLSSFPEDNALVADGVSSTTIRTSIYETTTHSPVADAEVYFSTTLGSITGSSTTNSSGLATATLTAGLGSGTATIVVRFGALLTDTVSVQFFGSGPSTFHLTRSPASILADGVSTTTITAEVLDTLGHPVAGELVHFSTNLGTLTDAYIQSGSDGLAEVELTSLAGTADLVNQVQAYLVAAPAVGDSINTLFRGVTLVTHAADTLLVADGSAGTEIEVSLYETTNHAALQNRVVYFTTSLGSITGDATTNSSGSATATLTTGTLPGTATIHAITGNTLRDTVQVRFLSHSPRAISLQADPASVLADGESTAEITALLTDTLGNPVAGTRINFTTSLGTLTPTSVLTDDYGEAVAFYRANPSATDSSAQVIATVTNFPALRDTLAVGTRGITLGISADPTQIPANGTSVSTITINIQETTNGNPVAGKDFSLATTRGTIPSGGTTDAGGQAALELISNTSPGTAVVTVTAGLSNTTTVQFLSAAPHSLSLASSETSLLADGQAASEITALITDVLGNPVPAATVGFTTNFGSLSSATAITAGNGEATLTFTSAPSTSDTLARIQGTVAGYAGVRDSAEVICRGITLTIQADPDLLPANGSATSTITAGLQETSSGNPLTNTTIFWSTTLGIIPGSSTTNSLGQATTTLTAGVLPGTAQVAARSGVTSSTTVTFLPIAPTDIAVSASNSSILADGSAATEITAVVTDTLGNPVSGERITFSTTAGSLSPGSVYTDGDGEAFTTLTSSASGSDLSATVTATVSNTPALNSNIAVTFRGITLTALADPQEIIADGVSTATISINLQETTNGNPVGGKVLALSTNLGSIPSTATTNSAGQAAAVLTSGTTPGTATVTINAGISTTATVQFLTAAPTSITVTPSSSSIRADGSATTLLTAAVTDTLGNPVTGRTISFSTTAGTLSSSSQTSDSDGEAAVILTADTSAGNVSATVTATVSGIPALNAATTVTFRGITLTISASPAGIIADGSSTSTISLNLHETGNGNPVTGTTINLTTTRGSIPASVTTGSTGNATAVLTSGTAAGTATVTATAGVRKSTTVTLLSPAPTDMTLGASTTSILADASATTLITATITDTLGNPVPGKTINFTASAGTPAARNVVTNSNGEASFTLTGTASTTNLSARVRALVSGTTAVKDSVDITFRGLTLTISANPGQIPADGSSTATINLLLKETVNGNPIANRAIALSTTAGSIPTSATTNTGGVAAATLTSSTTPGTATITATAGVSSTTNVDFLTTDPTAISIARSTSSILADGSATTLLTAAVTDTLGNPVTGRTISFSTTAGTLSSSSQTSDSDGEAAVTLTADTSAGNVSATVTATVSGIPALNASTTVTFRGITLTISASPAGIIADGSSTSTISLNLHETGNGNPVTNTTINLATTRGSVPASVTTGSAGNATAVLTSGTAAGTATVTATAGVRKFTTVNFLPSGPTGITLAASSSSILADGVATTLLTAAVTDTLGNPVTGRTISFNTTAGTLSSSSQTSDSDGEAAVILTADTSAGNVSATVTATVSGIPALNASTSVTFRGITLTISASPAGIIADGSSTSTISLNLHETGSGNPVTNTTINLATTRGSIPASVTTGSTGNTTAVLTSGTAAGTATVTATAGVRKSTTVNFLPSGPTGITLAASSSSILADNQATTTITATVTDTLGDPVSGAVVSFSATQGTLSDTTATTTAAGQASTTLTSSASTTNISSTVTGSVGSLSNTTAITFRGVSLTVSASPDRIPADGVSTSAISVHLYETVNGNPVTGRGVSLSTTRGAIPATDTTGSTGRITVNLTSSTAAGTATVTASAGVSNTASVTFSALQFSVSAPDTNLIADGVSSAQVIAHLQDSTTGNPLSGKIIYWSTTRGSIPASSTTGTSGNATAQLTAGTSAGTAVVTGRYGNTLTATVTFLFSTPSDSLIILSWSNPSGNPDDGTEDLTVTALFSDASGNPLVGDTIRFALTPNTVGTIVTPKVTDASGSATTTLSYATQYVGTIVRVRARYYDGGGILRVSGYIDITLPAAN